MKNNYITYMYLHAIMALDFVFLWYFLLFSFFFFNIIVEPACGERDIAVTIFVRCMCVRAPGFVWAITCTFMHGFQNNLVQLLSLGRRNVI